MVTYEKFWGLKRDVTQCHRMSPNVNLSKCRCHPMGDIGLHDPKLAENISWGHLRTIIKFSGPGTPRFGLGSHKRPKVNFWPFFRFSGLKWPISAPRMYAMIQNFPRGTREYPWHGLEAEIGFLLGVERLKRLFRPFLAIFSGFSFHMTPRRQVMDSNCPRGTKEYPWQVLGI